MKRSEILHRADWCRIAWSNHWIHNLKGVHHRVMANFLRKRGWVVFYLDEPLRHCNGQCWLEAYKSVNKKED
jgi:hypothetical protein